MEALGSTDNVTFGGQNSIFLLENVDVGCNNADISIGRNSNKFEWYGGSVFTNTTAPDGFNLGNECGSVFISGVDCSAMDRLVNVMGAEVADCITFNRCKLPSVIRPVTFTPEQGKFRLYNCHSTDDYYRFREESYAGQNLTETAIYRDATYDGTNGYSIRMYNQTGNAPKQAPNEFMIAELPSVDLSSAKTFTVEIVLLGNESTPANAQNDEIWIRAEATDSTDLALAVYDYSTETMVFETAADLTASTATWTGLGTYYKKHKLSVTTTAVTGATDVPMRFWIYATNDAPGDGGICVCPAIDIT